VAGLSALFSVIAVFVMNGWIIAKLCRGKVARKSTELKLTLQTMVIGLLLVAYFMVGVTLIFSDNGKRIA